MSASLTPTKQRRKSRKWMLVFVALVALCAMALGILWLYTQSIQLTLAELDVAYARWKSNRPKDYKITYAKIVGRNKRSERIFVRVRGGHVAYATLNDRSLNLDKAKYYDVESMFKDMRAFVEGKNQGSQSTVCAVFDAKLGYPIMYTRSSFWGGESVKIQVSKFEAE